MKSLKARLTPLFFYLFANPLHGQARDTHSVEEKLIETLNLAESGDVIDIPAGTYHFKQQLSISADHVVLRGAGMYGTTLSFVGQEEGSEGLLITGSGVILEDFGIMDTRGDGIKMHAVSGGVIRRVRVGWSGEPKAENGAYGLYPVQSEKILLEGNLVFGASDAGVYVGQSKKVIVRNNEVYNNVAGIEIENTSDADVYKNFAHHNTGGILVFHLPHITGESRRVRVFDNTIAKNNTPNFAPPSNTVGDVPTGSGIMITGAKGVEVFNNILSEHRTAHIIMMSYSLTGRPYEPEKYDPFSESIFVKDNTYFLNGYDPMGGSTEITQNLVEVLKEIVGLPFPHILYDGSVNPSNRSASGEVKPEKRICIEEDSKTPFVNLDLDHQLQGMTRDILSQRCELERLKPVSF